MKSYRATYKKKSGDLRNMHFAKISDLPAEFVASKIKGKNTGLSALSEGSEVVWDLDVNGFRIFNWKTVEGDVLEEEINFAV